jgi:hypothetical protein
MTAVEVDVGLATSRRQTARVRIQSQHGAQFPYEVEFDPATRVGDLLGKLGGSDVPVASQLIDASLDAPFPADARLIDVQLLDGQLLRLEPLDESPDAARPAVPALSLEDEFRLVHEAGPQLGYAWPVRTTGALELDFDQSSGVLLPMVPGSRPAALSLTVLLTARAQPDACVLIFDGALFWVLVGGRICQSGAEVPAGALLQVRVAGADESLEPLELRLLSRAEHEQIRRAGSLVPYRVRPAEASVTEVDSTPIRLAAPAHKKPPKWDWIEVALQDGSMLGAYVAIMAFTGFRIYYVLFLVLPLGRVAYRLYKYRKDVHEAYVENEQASVRFDTELGVVQSRVIAEVEVIYRRNPSLATLSAAVHSRGRELWQRQPTRASFLRVSTGVGVHTSTTPVDISGNETDPRLVPWRAAAERLRSLGNAPVEVGLLDTNFGVVGSNELVAEYVADFLLRLCMLHSPGNVSIAALLPTDGRERLRYSWMSWLPHARNVSNLFQGHRFVHGPARVREAVLASTALAEDAPSTDEWLILLVHEAAGVDAAELKAYQDVSEGRVRILWVGNSWLRQPVFVDTWLVLNSGAENRIDGVLYPDPRPVIGLGVSGAVAEHVAAQSAALTDETASAGSRSIPLSVPLGDICAVPSAQLSSVRSLVARLGADSSPLPFEIDFVKDGPHVLIAGTTGSGKSELLRSVIMSLASRYDPTDLSMLFVDYKGGASLDKLSQLPHCVGSVSNLATIEVGRIVKFLNADLLRRQAILKDFSGEYREYRKQRSGLPRLLVVIDEFGGFMSDGGADRDSAILNIAARGRSLGVHLILATQSPKGVVTGPVRANVNARICLRTLDQDDSIQVIDAPDAALLSKAVPGRGYARFESGSIRQFQSAHADFQRLVTATTTDHIQVHASDPVVDGPPNLGGGDDSDDGVSDLSRLVSQAVAIGLQPAADDDEGQPNLKPSLWRREDHDRATPLGSRSVRHILLLGTRDEPERQRQSPFLYDLSEGGILFNGGVRTGRTSILQSLGEQFLAASSGGEVVVVDGGDSLASRMPSASWRIRATSTPDVKHLLAQLDQDYGSGIAPLLLLIDRIDVLQDALSEARHLARHIAGGGHRGVYVAATADPRLALDSELRRSFRLRCLFVGERPGVFETEDGVVGESSSVDPSAPFPYATPLKPATLEGTTWPTRYPTTRDARTSGIWRPVGYDAAEPQTPELNMLEPGIVVGVDTVRHESVQASLVPGLGITGTERSGRTTTLLTIGLRAHARIAATLPRSAGVFLLAPYEQIASPDWTIRNLDMEFADLVLAYRRSTGGVPSDFEAFWKLVQTHRLWSGNSRSVILIDEVERLDEMFPAFVRAMNGAQSTVSFALAAVEQLANNMRVSIVGTMSFQTFPNGSGIHASLPAARRLAYAGQNFLVLRPPPRHLVGETLLSSEDALRRVSNTTGREYRIGEGIATLLGRYRDLRVVPEISAIAFADESRRARDLLGGGL